jgi:hypothetical protein
MVPRERDAEIAILRRALRQHDRHRRQRQHVVDHGGAAEQTGMGRQRRLCPHDPAPAFEAFEQRGLFAADIGAGAHLDVEPMGRAGHGLAEQPLSARDGDRRRHRRDRMGVFRTDVDIPLGRADGDAGDDHPLDQDEGIALHDHAVGKGSTVALVGVADDVLLWRRRLRNRPPLDTGRKTGAAPPAQARLNYLFDDTGGSERQRALQSGQAAMGAIVGNRTRIDHAAARKGQPGLALEPGDVVGDAVGERMCARMASRMGKRGVEHTGGGGRCDRTKRQAPRRRRDLDQRLQPVKGCGQKVMFN